MPTVFNGELSQTGTIVTPLQLSWHRLKLKLASISLLRLDALSISRAQLYSSPTMCLPTWLNTEQPANKHEEGTPTDADEVGQQAQPPPKINHKNMLNVVAFVVNLILTWGVGNFEWLGEGTNNGEISRKYQTLVTPSFEAFSIWAVIFLFHALFTIVQLLRRYRAVPMVQQGVSYWYCSVTLCQVAWQFAFSFERIALSMAFMLGTWLSLMGLLYNQYYAKSDGTRAEFWLLRFPFSINAGWITAATALNVSVLAVWKVAPGDVQLAIAIISLALLHAISVWVLFNIKKGPNYTIACVLSWAFGWVYKELQNPTELILNAFSQDTIDGVAYAVLSVTVVIMIQVVIRVAMGIIDKVKRRKNGGDDSHDDDVNENVGDDGAKP